MARTFEELVSQELDSLYQGALFLSGGDGERAEKLLVDAMTVSFREREHGVPDGSRQRWLEGRLVQRSLLGAAPAPGPVYATEGRRAPGAFAGLEADTLFAAAAVLPPLPRAAVWLVLLRRWRYREACEVLGVDLDELEVLLRHRDRLMGEILRGSRRGKNADRRGRG